jgi:hypothetical protein
MQFTSMMMIFALVAAGGLIGMLAIDLITTFEAEAKGCQPNSLGFNAAQGRCFHP